MRFPENHPSPFPPCAPKDPPCVHEKNSIKFFEHPHLKKKYKTNKTADPMTNSHIDGVKLLLGLYITFSVCEWIVHAKLMHNPAFDIGRRHLAHHDEVMEDMSISRTQALLDNDDSRGTTLNLQSTFLVFSIGCCAALCVRKTIAPHTPVGVTIGLSIIATLYQTLTWNAIHPKMHGIQHSEMQARLLPNRAFHWMVSHHAKHHRLTNRNFNITFPGGDILFSTFSKGYV